MPLLIVANILPFMSLEFEGRRQETLLLSGVLALWHEGQIGLALLVLLLLFVIPIFALASALALARGLRAGRPARRLAPLLRLHAFLRRWAMLEVHALAVLVAFVKLRDLAEVEPGAALGALAALVLLLLLADLRLEPALLRARLRTSDEANLGTGCPDCGELLPAGEVRDARSCPGCGGGRPLPRRDALARSAAWLVAAAAMYLPANLLPVMTVVHFGREEPTTILSGVARLYASGMWPIALVVLTASVVVPLLKFLGLGHLLLLAARGRAGGRVHGRLYRLLDAIGRWSMVDVFVVALLAALVSLGNVATIEPGSGASAFAAVVVFTMLAAHAFDPRLLWSRPGPSHAQRG